MKTIRVNWRRYNLYWITGNVLEASKSRSTSVSGGGGSVYMSGGQAQGHVRPVTSATTVHDQIFIADNEGKEHSLQLQNFDVACRAGNKLSVLWAIKNGRKSGPYVAAINHSTSEKFFDTATLKKMYYPVNILFLNILFVFAVFLFLLPGFWIHELCIIFILFMLCVFYLEQKTKRSIRKFKESINPAEFN